MKCYFFLLFSFQELYDIHFYFVKSNYLNIFAFLNIYTRPSSLRSGKSTDNSSFRQKQQVSLKHYYIPPMHNRRASFPQKSVNNGKFTISVEKQL